MALGELVRPAREERRLDRRVHRLASARPASPAPRRRPPARARRRRPRAPGSRAPVCGRSPAKKSMTVSGVATDRQLGLGLALQVRQARPVGVARQEVARLGEAARARRAGGATRRCRGRRRPARPRQRLRLLPGAGRAAAASAEREAVGLRVRDGAGAGRAASEAATGRKGDQANLHHRRAGYGSALRDGKSRTWQRQAPRV